MGASSSTLRNKLTKPTPNGPLLEEWMRRTGEAEIVHKVGQKELLRRDPRFRVYG